MTDAGPCEKQPKIEEYFSSYEDLEVSLKILLFSSKKHRQEKKIFNEFWQYKLK